MLFRSEEANPKLCALQAAARRRGVPFVWDDDEVSLGMGHKSQCWPSAALPQVEAVDWASLSSVPLAYITGTNGKTTSTRMCARIMEAAAKVPGATSSDGVVVGREQVERGDWTGTGAARRVLRHPEVVVALDHIWEATDVDGSGGIDREEYLTMHRKIVLALDPTVRPKHAFAAARDDWAREIGRAHV